MSVAEPRSWIVVGGGVAGLLAARRLAAQGHDVTVHEVSEQPGGRVSRLQVDGIGLDAGAESFATRGGHVAALATDLGLRDRIVTPSGDPAWVVTPIDAYPLPETGWMGIPVTPLARDVRRAVGLSGALRAIADKWLGTDGVEASSSMGEVARSRLGDAVTDRLIAPVVQGVYSRPLDEITLADIAPDLAEQIRDGGLLRTASARRAAAPAGSAVMGIDGGMWRLTEALAADARARGARIETESPVGAVERAGTGWKVWVEGTAHRADAVVLAVPRPSVAALVADVERHDDRQVALVTMALDAPELDEAPRGSGVLAVGNVSGAKALTHSSAKWAWVAREAEGHHIVRLSYRIDNAADARGHALDDASVLLGTRLRERQLRDIERVQWNDAAPSAIADREPSPGLHLVGSAAGRTGLAAIVADDAASSLGA